MHETQLRLLYSRLLMCNGRVCTLHAHNIRLFHVANILLPCRVHFMLLNVKPYDVLSNLYLQLAAVLNAMAAASGGEPLTPKTLDQAVSIVQASCRGC